jgi:hypothetical protein
MNIARTARFFLITAGIFPLCAQKGGKEAPPLSLSLPDKTWSLLIDVSGFKIQRNEKRPNGRYLLAQTSSTGVTLSITLSQVQGVAMIDDCRRVFRQRNQGNAPLHPTDSKESQAGDMAISEFTFNEISGVQLRQRNVFGCLPKDDVYIDIHLSKVEYTAKDEPRFASILQSVRFSDQAVTSNSPADSKSYFAEGSKFFLANQFDKAIAPYQKALDLEKADRKLDDKLWYVLVDNLTMAYGISGDLKSAEEVVRYGLTKNSDYPLFYYNLACIYAEKNEMDRTMEYLTQAFERKKNVLPGEKMPDAARDDSFQRFMKDDKFRKFVRSL